MARKSQAELLARRTKALQLKAAGATWQQVADKAGYSTRQQAHKDVTAHFQAEHSEAAEQYRFLELERLDQMTKGVFPKALKGDVKAVDAMIKIMTRRAKYIHGLEVPQEHNLSANDGSIQVILSPNLGEATSMAEVEVEVEPDAT